MYKECHQCLRKNAIAKKTCLCGYVFLAKKTSGFKEMPVILTPERLRHTPSRHVFTPSRHVFTPSRPVHNETSPDSIDEFFHVSTINQPTNPQGGEDDATEEDITEDDVSRENKVSGRYKMFAEKLYPKRERIPRFYEHNSLISIKRKTQPILAESLRKQHLLDEQNHISWENKKNNIRLVESFPDSANNLNQKCSPNSSLIRSPSVVMLRKPDGNFLTENIDANIEIEINNEADIPLTLHDVEDEEICTFHEDNVFAFNSSSHKMIVNRVESLSCENKNEKELFPGKQLNADVSIKRGVGRPRKHPIHVKIKRPVGRPRKHPITSKHYNDIISSELTGTRNEYNRSYHHELKMADSESLLLDADDVVKRIVKIKRPVGRPPKNEYPYNNIEVKIKRPVGRPRKNPKPSFNGLQVTPFKSKDQQRRAGRCFLSPPSLIASAKRERIKNEMLQTVEKERLQKKLAKDRGVIIPPHKRELYKLILEEINRRMCNQAFQSNLH